MSEKQKDPAEGWTHEGGGVWVPPLRRSEGATLEPAGPAGSLACDGVVGGRPSRADLETLRDGWRIRAGETAKEADYHREKYEYTTAYRHDCVKTAYLLCASQLDRLLASSNERQPTPNIGSQTQPSITNQL